MRRSGKYDDGRPDSVVVESEYNNVNGGLTRGMKVETGESQVRVVSSIPLG